MRALNVEPYESLIEGGLLFQEEVVFIFLPKKYLFFAAADLVLDVRKPYAICIFAFVDVRKPYAI